MVSFDSMTLGPRACTYALGQVYKSALYTIYTHTTNPVTVKLHCHKTALRPKEKICVFPVTYKKKK